MKKKGKQEEKYKTHIATPDFYLHYANKHFREQREGSSRGILDKDSSYYISPSAFSKVLNDFNIAVRDLILYDGFEFKLPSRMGILCIRKYILVPYIDKNGVYKNPLPIDWKATSELWEQDEEAKEQKKLVRHRNKHSGGYISEWTFKRAQATFTNKSVYTFKAARTAKQKLSKIMLNFENNLIDYQLK